MQPVVALGLSFVVSTNRSKRIKVIGSPLSPSQI